MRYLNGSACRLGRSQRLCRIGLRDRALSRRKRSHIAILRLQRRDLRRMCDDGRVDRSRTPIRMIFAPGTTFGQNACPALRSTTIRPRSRRNYVPGGHLADERRYHLERRLGHQAPVPKELWLDRVRARHGLHVLFRLVAVVTNFAGQLRDRLRLRKRPVPTIRRPTTS